VELKKAADLAWGRKISARRRVRPETANTHNRSVLAINPPAQSEVGDMNADFHIQGLSDDPCC
jgi:hypothetical protein